MISVSRANFESMKRIMKKVRHPFIVELLDDIKSQQNIFLIIELVRGGDLYDFITESGMFQRVNVYLVCIWCKTSGVTRHFLDFRVQVRDFWSE